VICGDRHWQYVSTDPDTGVREYACGPSSDAHAGGYNESMRTPMHHYLKIRGGFLMILVDRENDKPSITFRHYGTDGSICHEDRFTTK
jgi:alkaline phosphatase D